MKHFSEKEFWCRCSQCQKGDAEMGIYVFRTIPVQCSGDTRSLLGC